MGVWRIVIHQASYEQGWADGEDGREMTVPHGGDGLSYWSGYIEGMAVRERAEKEKEGE